MTEADLGKFRFTEHIIYPEGKVDYHPNRPFDAIWPSLTTDSYKELISNDNFHNHYNSELFYFIVEHIPLSKSKAFIDHNV